MRRSRLLSVAIRRQTKGRRSRRPFSCLNQGAFIWAANAGAIFRRRGARHRAMRIRASVQASRFPMPKLPPTRNDSLRIT